MVLCYQKVKNNICFATRTVGLARMACALFETLHLSSQELRHSTLHSHLAAVLILELLRQYNSTAQLGLLAVDNCYIFVRISPLSGTQKFLAR